MGERRWRLGIGLVVPTLVAVAGNANEGKPQG